MIVNTVSSCRMQFNVDLMHSECCCSCSCYSEASVMVIATEDQGLVYAQTVHLMTDFHAHASVDVLQKVRAAN